MTSEQITYQPGDSIKVRDKWQPKRSRRSATVIEDRGDEGVVCYVHTRQARGGGWHSTRQIVARERII